MVGVVADKIASNGVYPACIRNEVKSYEFRKPGEESAEFSELKNLYGSLTKNGNAEKFYEKFYSSVPLNATKYFEGLSRNAATLLSTKIAVHMLALFKEKAVAVGRASEEVKRNLSDKEMAGLQYIGGYVLHKLHKKHASSKFKDTPESQQVMSLLKAGKADDVTTGDSQRLISSLNRGGLWAITVSAQKLFERTEHQFRIFCPNTTLQRLDITGIASKTMSDVEAVRAWNTMLSNSELVVDADVSKDLFLSIINLYVRVRSFSFAKDVIQKYKMKQKQFQAKALRKEIQRAGNDSRNNRQI